jgi:hypothetical protein
MPSHARLALAAFVTVLLSQATAGGPPPPPGHLVASYDPASGAAHLSWTPPDPGRWTYVVWRDDGIVGSTSEAAFTDESVPTDTGAAGFLYFVAATRDGRQWSKPAIIDLPTLACEIVTVSTSWEYPYVTARLHEECLDGAVVYDKKVTWAPPA